ncbi:hypothetical protein I7X10_05605 [Bacillus halotolerans]|nr:hypothetical protein I7X10_05605 [Bacillus halotolerans]
MFKRGTAHVLEAPEHGRTVNQTVKGSFARINHQIDLKKPTKMWVLCMR